MVAENRRRLALLLEDVKAGLKSLDHRKKQATVARPELKKMINDLWVDPGRGNFGMVQFCSCRASMQTRGR